MIVEISTGAKPRQYSNTYFHTRLDIPPLANVYDIATAPNSTDPHDVPILGRSA